MPEITHDDFIEMIGCLKAHEIKRHKVVQEMVAQGILGQLLSAAKLKRRHARHAIRTAWKSHTIIFGVARPECEICIALGHAVERELVHA